MLTLFIFYILTQRAFIGLSISDNAWFIATSICIANDVNIIFKLLMGK